MKPKISVIIPVYNREESINISIESLKSQNFKEFEVIIIDDGSSDSTARVINKFMERDDRFKYFYQNNSGVAMARNAGIDRSEGEYICFLDSDDYYDSTYLEKMYEKIIRTSSDICYCGYYLDKPNCVEKIKTEYKQKNVLSNYIKGKIKVPATGWLIKRNIIVNNQIRFPDKISWGEDFYFFCKVLASTNLITYVKEHLVYYRFDYNSNQLSSFSLDKIDKDYDLIMKVTRDRLINSSKEISLALIDYKLTALITYRLIKAISKNIDINVIFEYYAKYRENINISFSNGLRSMKLNYYIILLKYRMKRANRKTG